MNIAAKFNAALRDVPNEGAPGGDVVPPVVAIDPAIEAELPVEEAAPEPEPAPAPAPRTVPLNTMLERVSREQRRAQTAEERAEVAERRAQEAEALAQRLQTGGDRTAVPPAPAPRNGNAPDFTTAVQQEAAKQRLYEDSAEIMNKATVQFGPAFQESLAVLRAVGAVSDDFVSDVIAVDKANAHVIFDKIAKDPERAVALAGMDSRKRTAELTRISMAVAAENKPAADVKPIEPVKPTATKQVSRAPSPPPPVDPSTSKVIDWRSDAASDAEFSRGFDEHRSKRAAHR